MKLRLYLKGFIGVLVLIICYQFYHLYEKEKLIKSFSDTELQRKSFYNFEAHYRVQLNDLFLHELFLEVERKGNRHSDLKLFKRAKRIVEIRNQLIGGIEIDKKDRAWLEKEILKFKSLIDEVFVDIDELSENPVSLKENLNRKDFLGYANGSEEQVIFKLVLLEEKALNHIGSRISEDRLNGWDALPELFSIPDQKIIENGSNYSAKMFLGIRFPWKPKLSVNGKGIRSEFGVGKVEFKALHEGDFKDGIVEKTWVGSATIPTPFGDTTITKEFKYFIKE